VPKALVNGRGRWLIAAAAVAASLPVVVALITAVSDSWAPVGDRAVGAARAYDVFSSHPPLVGAYSTSTLLIGETTYSPGPLLSWLLALPAHLPGLLALPLTMALVNLASVVGSVLLAHRRAGPVFALVAAMAIAVMCSSLPADLPVDIWSGSVPVLPFWLLRFVGWSVACGEVRLLPLGVVLASFVAQCHLAYLLPSVFILVIGGVGLIVRRHDAEGTLRRWLVVALLAGVVCWSLPVLDQVMAWTGRDGHGNLARIVDAAGSRGNTAGAEAGVRAVARTVGISPWWLRELRSPQAKTFDIFAPLSALAIASTVIVLLGLAAALIAAWRKRRQDVVTASAIALALCLAVGLFTMSFPNQGGMIFSYSYGSWWAAPAGMWVWLVLGWATIVLVPLRRPALDWAHPAVTGVAVAAVLGVGLWAGLRDRDNGVDPDEFAPVRELISQVGAGVPKREPVRVTGESFVFTASVVFALRREGLAVGGTFEDQFGTSYGVEGRRFAQVLDIRNGLAIRPGARLIARVNAPGPPPEPVTVSVRPAP